MFVFICDACSIFPMCAVLLIDCGEFTVFSQCNCMYECVFLLVMEYRNPAYIVNTLNDQRLLPPPFQLVCLSLT